jgi:hypothetical protein
MFTTNYYRLFDRYTFVSEKSFTCNEIFYEGAIDETADPADYLRINTKAVLVA